MRKARPEDKEAVLKMTEVYNGRDYLPAYYDHFLTSSDMFPAVMLQGDKIVSFSLKVVIQVI